MRRFNIPGIIGLIISGVVVGPYGLNFLEKNSAIDLFSTIGLLYIMFIAGLELDMAEFKQNKYKSILFGFFTFAIPFSIGFPICHYFLDYNLNASLLIASMFSTHTLVAYPIVSRLGVSKNPAVAVAVGGTILTDTAVLIVLAVIMGSNQGNLNQDFWITLGVSITIFSVIMFLIIPRITKLFFAKLESEKHAHYIFVLSVVFFAAFLAEIAGLEPIIGAFVAGLALNQLIPHSSALMNRIEFIGNSLFIPFFLISVGMLINFKVILSGPNAIFIAVVLTVVALIGKWVAAFLTQVVFKFSKLQRQLIFGLSSSHAAAVLAVVLVGYKAGIIDENVLNGTIILILVTCMVASFTTEKAAKKMLLIQNLNKPVDRESDFVFNEHILLPIANVSNFDKLLEFTLLMKETKSANPVTILSVVPNDAEAESNIVLARKKLEGFKMQGAASEIKVNTIATIDHNPSSGIARISREIMADIIVLGWPSKVGFFDRFIGDKLNSIISNVDKNLFVCRLEKHLSLHKRIIVITTPFAEKEFGFIAWLMKIAKLSKELSIPIVHFGCKDTTEAIGGAIKHYKINVNVKYAFFDDWEDFLVLSRSILEDDLLVLVSARKNSISYVNYVDNIPSKLEKYFSRNDRIIIYPRQYQFLNEQHEDIAIGSLGKGIEVIESLGKGIGHIFKKD